MDNIIDNILAIDQSAVDLIQKSEEVKSRILAETALEKQRLLDEAKARLEAKVEDYRNEIEQRLSSDLSAQNELFEEQKKKLKENFEANRPTIENDILDRLIRGEV